MHALFCSVLGMVTSALVALQLHGFLTVFVFLCVDPASDQDCVCLAFGCLENGIGKHISLFPMQGVHCGWKEQACEVVGCCARVCL